MISSRYISKLLLCYRLTYRLILDRLQNIVFISRIFGAYGLDGMSPP